MAKHKATNRCLLCNKGVDKDDPTTWKQVVGFVGGPRKDSMRLREDTGKYAHDACVKKIASGQALDQADLFGEEQPKGKYLTKGGVVNVEDILDD